MKLIIGLGNPGSKYEKTRHNIGFMVIDELANQLGIALDKQKFKGQYGYKSINGEKVFLLKPLTYMNLSGESVRPFIDFYKIASENIVVIYDDLDLPVGKVRLRQKGGHGGHNGIKSLITHIGSQQFNRIRVGIDRPKEGENVVTYVLDRFKEEEKAEVKNAIERSAQACQAWLKHDFPLVMNQFN